MKEHGVTVLFSTHITSDLEKCADHIIYIRKGKIILADTKDNFSQILGMPEETLEETMLRLEKEARNEESA